MSDGYVVASVTVSMEKEIFSQYSNPLHYTYKVYHEGAKDKETFEFFHVLGRKEGYMRNLSVPSKCVAQGKFLLLETKVELQY